MASYDTSSRNARLQVLDDNLDSDTNPADIAVYAGTVPDDVGASLGAATLLVVCELSSPPFSGVTGGVATFDSISIGTNVASGTATFARLRDGAGVARIQVTAGDTNEELLFDDAGLVTGGTVEITSGSITEGNP